MLLVLVFEPLLASSYSDRHKETVIFYVDGGPFFPLGSSADRYKVGAHGGGGISFVVARSESVSGDVGVRFDFYHFRYKDSRDCRYGTLGTFCVRRENFSALSVEGRLIVTTRRWLRPYFTAGVGVFDLQVFDMHQMTMAGVGADIAIDKSGTRPFYVEVRIVDTFVKFIRVDVGIRLTN